MFGIRFRVCSLAQFVYSVATHRSRIDLEMFVEEILVQEVIKGHIGSYGIALVGDNDGIQFAKSLITDDIKERVINRLFQSLSMGRKKSGLLSMYAISKIDHIDSCDLCQDKVLLTVKEDMELAEELRAVIQNILGDDMSAFAGLVLNRN